MDKTTLGNRMKEYENVSKDFLMRRNPVIIRIDGKAFHTFTKGFKKPFDDLLMETMQETAKYLCENIQGCKLAYTQSDEIILLLTDYEKLTTDAWFGYNIQKMVSISASMATLAFNKIFWEKYINQCGLRKDIFSGEAELESQKRLDLLSSKNFKAMFDARVFSIPKDEVCNYFIWRQQDCTKNSISMVAQSEFSHKQLQGKNSSQMQDILMLYKKINWNDFSIPKKRGTCITKVPIQIKEGVIRNKFIIDKEIPIFSKQRDYIEKLI